MIPNFQKTKLKNGMIVLYEKRPLNIVSLSITNPFGASHETSEIKGIAHLIEHLVFTGTKTRSAEQISKEIEKKGGILNAFTAQDVTSYWFKLPSKDVEIGIEILADILNNPIFDEKQFEKEKRVVLEEIKMYHDNPQRNIMEKLEGNLYKEPFGKGISGTKESVSSLQKDFVKNYFNEKYSPENYVVAIVGNVNFKKICDFLEKNFKPKNKKLKPIAITKQNKTTIEKRSHLDQVHFAIGMHAPRGNSRERYTLEVLDAYLANGMSSKLFIEIREKRGLAYAIRSTLNLEKTYSYYSIYVGTTKKAINEVKKLIITEFQQADKITEKILKESKERLIGLKEISSEESMNVMQELIFSEIISQAEDYYSYEDKINSITLKEVKDLSKKLIKNFSTSLIIPK